MSERIKALRAQLLPAYRAGLRGKHAELSALLAAQRAGASGAREKVGQLAHQIRGSGASFGHGALGVAAASVERASDDLFEDALVALLAAIEGAAEDGAEDGTKLLVLCGDSEVRAELIRTVAGRTVSVFAASRLEDAEPFVRTLEFDLIALEAAALGDQLAEVAYALRSELAPAATILVSGAEASPRVAAQLASMERTEVRSGPLHAELLHTVIAEQIDGRSHGTLPGVTPAPSPSEP